MPVLFRLYNLCWATEQVPSQWKVGAFYLLGKSAADKELSQPSNFRPIALNSCVDKVYTSIIKRRWQHFMLNNGYLNTSIQKAFVDVIPGHSEHQLKLMATIEEAWKKHKSISICQCLRKCPPRPDSVLPPALSCSRGLHRHHHKPVHRPNQDCENHAVDHCTPCPPEYMIQPAS